MKLFKRFWFDRETGEFNWAIVAIIALAGIFFFNVLTAKVNLPDQAENQVTETVSDIRLDIRQ
jgi:hypothetical protein